MSKLPQPVFNDEMIEKYGGEGPRYTSYPTAVQFSDRFGADEFLAAIAESNRLPIPPDLSVYVHVPFCANPCFYCGCNRVITRSLTAGRSFLESLERELDLIAPRIDDDRKLRQLHLGGGTPTFLTIGEIEHLIGLLKTHFRFAEQAELALEVDPRTTSPQGIRALRDLGFNRLSVGIQDLDPAVQNAVNRIHGAHEVAAIMGAARAVGFASISVDLIYGLPLQNRANFARTIEQVLNMQPDRISLFNYAHLPHLFKAQRQINSEDLPSAAERIGIFRDSLEKLLAEGFEFIGMDHFARPDDSLVRARQSGSMVRNFQGYATHGGLDLIGLGPSAISQVGDSFAQNERNLDKWAVRILEGTPATVRGLVRTTDDRIRSEVIERIMCDAQLDFTRLERRHQVAFRNYFAAEIKRLGLLADDGLIEWQDHGFKVTATGILFLRSIARAFDVYFQPSEQSSRRFSRVV